MKISKYACLALTSLLITTTTLPSFTTTIKANEISTQHQQQKNIVSKDGIRIYLINGNMYEWPADSPDPTPEQITAMKQERGKWSKAAKLLLKNYNKLPGWVKAGLSYGAANSLAKTLDTFSGTLEDGLTIGLEILGFSGGVARTFAQAIAWFLF
ncbi:hypothetical protein ACSBSA_10845 (plasmid) [Streptococcus suis]|uniref:Secreted protein n=1 Tax=Streptococcus suis TaxID=1307 RepID=A0A2H4I6W7_STRSU|nr:hypothetical protein [Streptococcus suis]ARS43186.1 hypothetical protein [Streptococcus suis]MCL4911346.1 hypothetical protein [Streptococcus suis]MCQ8272746.1 hypothetical protein [Streptococcus suis]MCQ8274846.1 hypothetical protein [Streptococcus suis]MDW8743682.1 hypothetical protein [Streptococcus suis]